MVARCWERKTAFCQLYFVFSSVRTSSQVNWRLKNGIGPMNTVLFIFNMTIPLWINGREPERERDSVDSSQRNLSWSYSIPNKDLRPTSLYIERGRELAQQQLWVSPLSIDVTVCVSSIPNHKRPLNRPSLSVREAMQGQADTLWARMHACSIWQPVEKITTGAYPSNHKLLISHEGPNPLSTTQSALESYCRDPSSTLNFIQILHNIAIASLLTNWTSL